MSTANDKTALAVRVALATIVVIFGATACQGSTQLGSDGIIATPTQTPAQEPTAAASADTGAQTDTSTSTQPPEETSTAPPDPPPTAPADSETPEVQRPAAPMGRVAPAVATSPTALAEQITEAERGLRSLDATPLQLADWGHLHQVAIRKLGYEPQWDSEFFEALPPDLRPATLLHVSARRALIDLSSGYDAADFIPAWEIVEPEPVEALLTHYQDAEAATGIEWEFLAAINLIETGMGRIRGLSSAGAQGPMQFLPTTWAEAGIGEGDINDPHDAIQGAARYLVRRGGPSDMRSAIWGYNNSDDYVTAVQAYAALLREDPSAYATIYNWEIYFFTEAGDVWLPAGVRNEESIDLVDFLTTHPWSAPDPGLR